MADCSSSHLGVLLFTTTDSITDVRVEVMLQTILVTRAVTVLVFDIYFSYGKLIFYILND